MEKIKVVIGVDEAGRGAFFSRIYSAAVVHDPNILSKTSEQKIIIRDSKKMTPRQRHFSYEFLQNNCCFGIGYCDEQEIDALGISRCNVLSMHRAIDDLMSKHTNLEIERIRVDGVLFQPLLRIFVFIRILILLSSFSIGVISVLTPMLFPRKEITDFILGS